MSSKVEGILETIPSTVKGMGLKGEGYISMA
jgi:hypothetical protein